MTESNRYVNISTTNELTMCDIHLSNRRAFILCFHLYRKWEKIQCNTTPIDFLFTNMHHPFQSQIPETDKLIMKDDYFMWGISIYRSLNTCIGREDISALDYEKVKKKEEKILKIESKFQLWTNLDNVK